MNRYAEAMLTVPHGYLKLLWIKLFHGKHFKFGKLPRVSRGAEFCVDRHTDIKIGEWFAIGRDASFRVRKNARVTLGKHVSFGDNCVLACHESIAIGDDTQIASGAQIYDHDHDFRVPGGVKAKKFKTAPVVIGNNVWIGANVIILRGTTIGDNSVIAAGSVVKGNVPSNTLLVQKKEDTLIEVQGNGREK